MNCFTFPSKVAYVISASMVATVLFVSSANAQSNIQFYFDPNASASGTGSGGSGTWDTDMTPDWYAPSLYNFDIPFPSPNDTDYPATANFDGVGGNVDVDGEVQPTQLNFGGSGTYTVSPDSVDGGTIDLILPSSDGYYVGKSGYSDNQS